MIERLKFLVLCSAVFSCWGVRSARACGGVVTEEKSVVVQSQQRVLISLLSDGTSHIVVQLQVPEASVPFAALTPVSGLPTLDPDPVDVDEMDELDERTRPQVFVGDPSSDDPGCNCDNKDSEAGGGFGEGVGVGVVDVVDIGPVTAAVLSAETSTDLMTWLADNAFVLPTTEQKTLDAYVGDGKYFIAFKRNKQAKGGASSVGISFSVPGDQRGYPLRMSRIGADAELGIQVFVAAPHKVAPDGSAPIGNFATLTLGEDLPEYFGADVATEYRNAIRAKVAEHGGKAFVVENVFLADDYGEPWRDTLGPKLFAITEPDQSLSRLVTVVKPSELTEDVSFTGDAPPIVKPEIFAARSAPRGRGHLALLGGAIVGLGVRRGARKLAKKSA